ncbi:MAG TPA: riboflavin biosynthesis protein RibF [Chloroflexota bacterium]|nr:riboflavin biosynthesis protein RibF [Chloroflexota bacterium]
MSEIVDFSSFIASEPSAVTIGVFDGVHRGHQDLIGRTISIANAKHHCAIVITFDPAPRMVLSAGLGYTYLLGLPERLDRIAAMGVDVIAILRFDRSVAQTPAATFIDELAGRFKTTDLIVGPDFALGRAREGTASVLSELGKARDLRVHQMPPFQVNGQRVSSTQIRNLILSGDVQSATDLLGHPPSIRGIVVPGAGRGRKIGVPTANVDVPLERCTPANGVYAAVATLTSGFRVPAAVNVGVRPSFDEGHRTVEAHLIDFEDNLYGQAITLEFIKRLREERRFRDVSELITQIRSDVAKARQVIQSSAAIEDKTGISLRTDQ